jgi:ribonuclease I
MFRKDFVYRLSAATVAMFACSAQAAPLQATQYADFDRYVLALSWQSGFCQSMHDRKNAEPDECRLQKESADKTSVLTIHGLWPGLPKSIAARGVDERRWMRFGCATRPVPNMPEAKAGLKCSAAETGLSLTGAAKLSGSMPGAGGNSCLERYEYAKHGICFGFDPDAYFGTMVRMNQEVKSSPLGLFLAAPDRYHT